MVVVYSHSKQVLVRDIPKVVPKSLQKRGWGLVEEGEYDTLPAHVQRVFFKGDFHLPKNQKEVGQLWVELEGYVKHYISRHSSMFFVDKDDMLQDSFFIYVNLLERYIPIYKRLLKVGENAVDATSKNCRVYHKSESGDEVFYKFFKLRPYLMKNLYYHSLNLAQKAGRYSKRFYNIPSFGEDNSDDFDRLLHNMAQRELEDTLDQEVRSKNQAKLEKILHKHIKEAIQELPNKQRKVANLYFLKDVGVGDLAIKMNTDVKAVRGMISNIEEFLLSRPDMSLLREVL